MTASPGSGPLRRLLHRRYLPAAVLAANAGTLALINVLPYSDAVDIELDTMLAVVILGAVLLGIRLVDTFVLAAQRARLNDREVPP